MSQVPLRLPGAQGLRAGHWGSLPPRDTCLSGPVAAGAKHRQACGASVVGAGLTPRLWPRAGMGTSGPSPETPASGGMRRKPWPYT